MQARKLLQESREKGDGDQSGNRQEVRHDGILNSHQGQTQQTWLVDGWESQGRFLRFIV